MTLDEALYSYLSGYTGLTALVAKRIYPLVLPQGGAYPCVSHQVISGMWPHAMGSDPGVAAIRVQIDCWGKTENGQSGYTAVKSAAAQVKAALQDYSGTMGGAGGVVVQRIFLEDEQDFYESEAATFRTMLEFIIWYEE